MKDGALPLLREALEALRGAESFEPEELESRLGRILAEHDVKPGKLYQPIRVAITGTSVSPGIFESLAVLAGIAPWSGREGRGSALHRGRRTNPFMSQRMG